jgi:hypothetical protein
MKKLLKYHTIQCNPDYYWENNAVAKELNAGTLKTYEEYKKACDNAGCIYYNEEVFNDFINK